MQITDTLTLDASGLSFTRDGFLVGEAKVSRAGNVQQYLGSELGLTGDQASKMFGVYRDPDVVFDSASMMSLAGRPVTRGHPTVPVTADNWRELAKGQVGGVIRRDGEHVVAPMAIMDAQAAQEVGKGARSLSAGYTVDVIPSVGTAADGTPYQFKQAGQLRFNHVAYLPDNNPRAGNTRLGDAGPDLAEAKAKLRQAITLHEKHMNGSAPTTGKAGEKSQQDMMDMMVEALAALTGKSKSSGGMGAMDATPGNERPFTQGGPTVALKTIIVDGLPVETTDAGEAAVNLLRGKLADAATAMTTAKATHDAALAAKDAELATKDAEITDLKGKVLDAAALDAVVADRTAVISKAKALSPTLDTAGKSNMDIKRAVLGDAAKDKSDAYVDAAFDLKTADTANDTVRDAIRHQDHSVNANDAWNDGVFASAGVQIKKGA